MASKECLISLPAIKKLSQAETQTYVGIGEDIVGGLVKGGIQNIMNNFLYRLIHFDSDLVSACFSTLFISLFFKFQLIRD